MDVIAGNLANAFTTVQEDGRVAPYQRGILTFASGDDRGGPGVHVENVRSDPRPPRMVFDPGHPHAVRDGRWAGYVAYPNVNPTLEYVDAMAAARAYELNVAMMNLSKGMIQQAVQLLA